MAEDLMLVEPKFDSPN